MEDVKKIEFIDIYGGQEVQEKIISHIREHWNQLKWKEINGVASHCGCQEQMIAILGPLELFDEDGEPLYDWIEPSRILEELRIYQCGCDTLWIVSDC